MIEKQVISLCLRKDFWDKAKNILSKDMFPKEYSTIFETITSSQQKYDVDLTVDELLALHRDRYPAMPESTRNNVEQEIEDLRGVAPTNMNMAFDLLFNLWRRDKAREIGDKALSIWTGQSDDFGVLQRIIDTAMKEDPEQHETFTIVRDTLKDLIANETKTCDFRFPLKPLYEKVIGLNRGDLGIIFARPEVGKTSFCCYLASEYVKAGHKVFYWANEERATRLKIRMFCSLLNMSKDELYDNVESCSNKLQDMDVENKLTVIDSVGTNITEIQSYCDLNKPDIIFIDQLDKIKVNGHFNRGDERLKEVYYMAREIAKRNKCLVWAVSQAGADAERKEYLTYDMLDGSKTGKAGEGDIIIGIGRSSDHDDNTTRFLNISKNKINGVHCGVTCRINVQTGVFSEEPDL